MNAKEKAASRGEMSFKVTDRVVILARVRGSMSPSWTLGHGGTVITVDDEPPEYRIALDGDRGSFWFRTDELRLADVEEVESVLEDRILELEAEVSHLKLGPEEKGRIEGLESQVNRLVEEKRKINDQRLALGRQLEEAEARIRELETSTNRSYVERLQSENAELKAHVERAKQILREAASDLGTD